MKDSFRPICSARLPHHFKSRMNLNNCLFHTSSPSRFIGTGPHSEPKSSNTLLTLSRRSVVLPCSNSRTKRSPTPAFSERSTCVSLYFLRISFRYCAMIVLACILHRLLEVPHSEYVPQMPFSGTRPKDMYQFCLFWVHIQGISLCTAHSEKVIIYLISGKYKEYKCIIPLFGDILLSL